MALRLLRGGYHASLAFVQKKSIEKVIAQYDADVSLDGAFGGYEFRPGVVDAAELTPPQAFDEFGMYNSRHIDAQTAALVKPVLERFKPLILEYLGKDCRLDDICLFWYVPSRARRRSISGGWHDDNCGHRLKMYLCLKGDGRTPTVFLPDSHRRKYGFRLAELRRFFGFADTDSRPGEVYLRYRTGDAALFDTHGLHRGLYEEPASERTTIVVEFINRHKSNRISGKAPCGPGSSRTGCVTFDAAAYQQLAATGLLDEQIVRRDGAVYRYSLANLPAAT
jgi:hypothetical protein